MLMEPISDIHVDETYHTPFCELLVGQFYIESRAHSSSLITCQILYSRIFQLPMMLHQNDGAVTLDAVGIDHLSEIMLILPDQNILSFDHVTGKGVSYQQTMLSVVT